MSDMTHIEVDYKQKYESLIKTVHTLSQKVPEASQALNEVVTSYEGWNPSKAVDPFKDVEARYTKGAK